MSVRRGGQFIAGNQAIKVQDKIYDLVRTVEGGVEYYDLQLPAESLFGIADATRLAIHIPTGTPANTTVNPMIRNDTIVLQITRNDGSALGVDELLPNRMYELYCITVLSGQMRMSSAFGDYELLANKPRVNGVEIRDGVNHNKNGRNYGLVDSIIDTGDTDIDHTYGAMGEITSYNLSDAFTDDMGSAFSGKSLSYGVIDGQIVFRSNGKPYWFNGTTYARLVTERELEEVAAADNYEGTVNYAVNLAADLPTTSVAGNRAMVISEKTIYTSDGTTWTAGTAGDYNNGDYVRVERFIDYNMRAGVITWNETGNAFDVFLVYSDSPDEVTIVTDPTTRVMSVAKTPKALTVNNLLPDGSVDSTFTFDGSTDRTIDIKPTAIDEETIDWNADNEAAVLKVPNALTLTLLNSDGTTNKTFNYDGSAAQDMTISFPSETQYMELTDGTVESLDGTATMQNAANTQAVTELKRLETDKVDKAVFDATTGKVLTDHETTFDTNSAEVTVEYRNANDSDVAATNESLFKIIGSGDTTVEEGENGEITVSSPVVPDIEMFAKVYYLDPLSTHTNDVTGDSNAPFKALADLLTAKGTETGILVFCRNTDTTALTLSGLTGWTFASFLDTKDGGWTNFGSVSLTNCTNCYFIGLSVLGTISISADSSANKFRYCSISDSATISGSNNLIEECTVNAAVSVSGAGTRWVNSTASVASTTDVTAGDLTLINAHGISLQQTGGTVTSLGATDFSPSPALGDGTKSIITSGTSVTNLYDGQSVNNDGTLAPIELGGMGYLLGKFMFEEAGSTITGTETVGGLLARQIYDSQTFEIIEPDGTKQSDVNKAMDAAIKAIRDDMANAGSNRGVVVNALTASTTNYVDTATITTAGAGYAVGDVVFVQVPTITDQIYKAWIIVDSIDGSGGVLTFTLSSVGAYAQPITGVDCDTTSETGTGCVLNITSAEGAATTLSTITAPKSGDVVDVLRDETNGGSAYRWTWADRNGDGIFNWVPAVPITNVELQGDNVYTTVTEGIITLVTAKKTRIDNAVQNTGDESIAGVKTFTSTPAIPASSAILVTSPTTPSAPATQGQVIQTIISMTDDGDIV